MTYPKTAAGAYLIALAVIVIDQCSKAWVLANLQPFVPLPVAGPLLRFTLINNPGVSFGLLKAPGMWSWVLVSFSMLVAGALAVWARRVDKPATRLALGLVIGGAVGNAIDRARLGHVTDFLDASGVHFPWIFNGADSFITVGVAILLIEGLLTRDPPKPEGVPS